MPARRVTDGGAEAGPLLILGASARAAAFSALRGGWSVQAIDLFADVDLAAQCAAEAVEGRDYPQALFERAESLRPCPWIYTGALENAPALIDRLARRQPLWGNPGSVLRRVRDPLELARVLRAADLPALDVADLPAGLPTDGSWLRKPRRSAGGARIEPWRGAEGEAPRPLDPREFYFQRKAEGLPVSAMFLAAEGRAELLGVTEQLIGTDWLNARPYHYAGSLGPIVLAAAAMEGLRQLGEALARGFGLVGLFGVDAIDDGSCLWPVEVNPRYTASTEILERAEGRSAVARHVAACHSTGVDPSSQKAWEPLPRILGKAIRFAEREMTITAEFVERALAAGRPCGGCEADPWRPSVADIPQAGSILPPGAPVFTCLAEGPSRQDVLAQLERQIGGFFP